MSAGGWRLLIVDDNEDNRYTLDRRLRREGYTDILTAENGTGALAALHAQPIDLVLLDIMMPDMNGYEVLEHMKADKDLSLLPVIMISAVEEIESVVRCIELGAEDYLSKPFNPTLLRARVGATLEKKRLRDEMRASLRRLEYELDSARKLQLGMLPKPFPAMTPEHPVLLDALIEPAREVGGDLYDYFFVGRTLWFLVGDVAGKGAPAAMYMARARSALRMAAEMWGGSHGEAPTPAGIAQAVNRELCRENDDRMFVTLFLGTLDMETGEVAYVNAGHPAPFVLRPGEVPTRLDGRAQMCLGIRDANAYAERKATLEPGDGLFLFSDGVTEAASGEALYGDDRLAREIAAHAGEAPSGLIAAVKRSIDDFGGAGGKADDVTMLSLRWRP